MTVMPPVALFQTPERDGVRCGLCPHNCLIAEGRRGRCGVREVRDGCLHPLTWGFPAAVAVDPIEKKPLYHFLPGSRAFSLATVGCNLGCLFCQNSSLSQPSRVPGEGSLVPPEELATAAVESSCEVIAHTYSEPTVFFEYARDVALAGRALGLANLFVTNGFLSADAARLAATFIDGANVDLKSFSDQSYRSYCRGRLQPVLETIEAWSRAGLWVEVTTLIVPGMNDSPEELREIARFICSISPSIPWHVSRFHPDFRLQDRGPTPASAILAACEIGREEGLEFVYAGNLPGSSWDRTCCPSCGALLIGRRGFSVTINRLTAGRCPDCGADIAGVWRNPRRLTFTSPTA